jgi:hypothetical protein
MRRDQPLRLLFYDNLLRFRALSGGECRRRLRVWGRRIPICADWRRQDTA